MANTVVDSSLPIPSGASRVNQRRPFPESSQEWASGNMASSAVSAAAAASPRNGPRPNRMPLKSASAMVTIASAKSEWQTRP